MKNLTYLLLFCLFSASLFAEQGPPPQWRKPADENLVYMHTDNGLIMIELAPFMAPNNVKQFANLVNEGFYDGLEFYRVIDGFVAQAGDEKERKKSEFKSPLNAEFTRKAPKNSEFMLIQQNAFLAPQTGYLHGFSAGRDVETQEEWLLHCPGHVAMARTNDADSATTEFYIVIGQAPRHLDRNMSSLGRVIHGMDIVQSFNRANANEAGGVIVDIGRRTKIQWARTGDKVNPELRVPVEVQIDDSEAAQQRLNSAKKMESPFYHFKGNGNLDLCYYQLRTRVLPY